jgi:hypothetical protein
MSMAKTSAMTCTILSLSSKSRYPFSVTTVHVLPYLPTYIILCHYRACHHAHCHLLYAADHLHVDVCDYMIAYLLILFPVLPPLVQLLA